MSAKERAEQMAVEAVQPKVKVSKAEPQSITLDALAALVVKQGEQITTLTGLMASNVKAPKVKAKVKKVSAPKAETPDNIALKPFRNVLQHPTTGAQTLGNLAFDVLVASPELAIRVRDGKGSIFAAREVYAKVAATGPVTVKPYAGESVNAAVRWDKAAGRLAEVASK